MKAERWARACMLLSSCLLTACDSGWVVDFAAPFPTEAADLSRFSARHQGVYTAADSTTSLCIGPRGIWLQQLNSLTISRHQLDSAKYALLSDSTYQDTNGRLHYLRVVGKEYVRDSWLGSDTLFTLAGPAAGHLRRFKGRYYLSTPHPTDSLGWHVQRLRIAGRRAEWEKLGHDTLRLRALDAATLRYRRVHGTSYFRLQPAPGKPTRQVDRYDGLWEAKEEFIRRH